MIKIRQKRLSENIIDRKDHQVNDFSKGEIVVLSERDLQNLDILCGVCASLIIVPRKLTVAEENMFRPSMFDGTKMIGKILVLK